MPLNILLTFIIGTTLGWLFRIITKASPDMQGLMLGCCVAGNLGNLPLIIVPAVCKENTSPFGAVDVPKQKQIMKPLKPLVQKLNLKVLLATATIGSILGLIIGVVPPFQKMFVGDDAPLGVIEDSASMLGDASIPAITLLLGANLLNGNN
ncbi:hypothetical protein glysoja_000712 [Glycine soja]|nr:hypothetical protein glysoja_000712 [Glycine soja]